MLDEDRAAARTARGTRSTTSTTFCDDDAVDPGTAILTLFLSGVKHAGGETPAGSERRQPRQ
jgi:hypothetical protein